jgi:dTDP-4-dehydrorhamnose reductase
MLGGTLVARWRNKFDVWGTSRYNVSREAISNFIAYDLKEASYDRLISSAQPDVIVHCAAITDVDYCEANPDEAFTVNADAILKFQASAPSVPLIFISSDAVFGCKTGRALEGDSREPINVYGESKKRAEDLIGSGSSRYLIVRTTILGRSFSHIRRGFCEWVVEASKSQAPVNLYTDVSFTPISIWHLADELEWSINNNLNGVFHIAGTDIISRRDLARAFCAALDVPTLNSREGKMVTSEFRAPRAKDQCLDSSAYERRSARKLPRIEETVDLLASFFRSGW